jgi:YVTN family beta-propeller protein
MCRYSSGRLPANRWPLWGLVALAALAACGGDSPAGPGRDITPGRPLFSTAPGDEALAYVTNSGSQNVSVIRTSDNTVVATVAVGIDPGGVAVTPDGAFAYVANEGFRDVSVIRTSDNTVVATVTVGTSNLTFPVDVAVTPDGAFVYVANEGSNNVSVIRTSDNTVVATVAVGNNPRGVAVTPTTQACTIEALVDDVEALAAAGKLSEAEGHALSVKLEAALRLFEQGRTKAAGNVIGAFLNQVEALVRSRRLSDADARLLRDQVSCVRTQLHG